MKIDKIYVVGLVILLVLALILVSLLAVKSVLYKPTVDTGVPFTDAQPLAPTPEITEGIGTAPAETTTSPEYVRERDKYLFLAVGVDKASGRGDAIMLVSFDTVRGDIAVMQIPRDTYVELDGEAMKINEILFLRDVYAIRDILEVTLCVNIDYTALIDLEALEVMVDAVGGVEIDVPFDMKYVGVKGDPLTDLAEDQAAEQKARTTYENLIRLTDDPDVIDPLRYLREREIVHFQRFGDAMRITQDDLDSKNFYAFNPAYDKK